MATLATRPVLRAARFGSAAALARELEFAALPEDVVRQAA
jgi:hypothetical protein